MIDSGAESRVLFESDFPLVTEMDRAIIACQDNDTLINWALMINHWEWPSELSGNKSGHWTYKTKELKIFGIILWRKTIRNTREYQIRKYIENIVGEKSILRKHNNHMSDEQFNDFWTKSYDEYYAKYHEKRWRPNDH